MEFFLTPRLAANLVYLLGVVVAVVYMAQLPDKSRNTRLVLTVLATWLVMYGIRGIYEVTHTHDLETGTGFNRDPLVIWSFLFCQSLLQIFLIPLMYRVGFVFAALEEKLTLFVASGFFLWVYANFLLVMGDVGGMVGYARIAITGTVLVNGWLVFAGVRKMWRGRTDARDARSRQLVYIVVAATTALFIYGWATSIFSYWPASAELRGFLPIPMAILFPSLLIVGYLLYGEERHSLLVKLVGFLVITYVAVYTMTVVTMSSDTDLRQQYRDPSTLISRVFTPDSLGGYRMEPATDAWTEPVGEGHRSVDDGAVGFKSSFDFEFYGSTYDSLWVGTNGSVSFGADIDADRTYSEGFSFKDDVPSAMPLYADLILGSAEAKVHFDTYSDRMVVSWINASIWDVHDSTVSMQVIFYMDGRIEFQYRHLDTIPLFYYSGISPGGEFSPVEFSQEVISVGAGQALFELQDSRIPFRRFVHPIVLPIARMGIIGFLLVFGLGMVFYRAGILRPLRVVLDGLGEVEQGNLNAVLVIEEKNELGFLADYFNRMTASLRGYSQKMEELVAQRTADLDKTIVDLKATQNQLVEQEKLASLGALTAGIAHEIKNPLNFVNNFAEVSAELSEEIVEALDAGNLDQARKLADQLTSNSEQIAKHGKRADSIVRAMMQHARGGASEMEKIELNTYLEEYVNLAWHGMRARDDGFSAEVKRAFDPAVGSITAMPQELGRVILNLLNNAFDAVRETENATITVATRALENAVEITVSDNGPGIPEGIREKIFEPFFTTKATGEGTGLGLSLSYDIITKGHGGTLKVGESTDGGAIIRITLPTNTDSA